MRKTEPLEYIGKPLMDVLDAIKSGLFGFTDDLVPLVESIIHKNDVYLVAHDFYDYAKIQLQVYPLITNIRLITRIKTRNSGLRRQC